jgi:hypothetical protein
MSKIRLDLDALQVESFDTTGGEKHARGTVRGNGVAADPVAADTVEADTCGGGCSWDSNCARSCPWTCAGDPESCGGSCEGTCHTCPDTCGRTCGETCGYGSCDTCLFYTCGGCATELPEYCYPA